MEHAGKALSSAPSEQPAAQDSELVDWLWQALTQMYGSSFLVAYGEDDAPPTIWRQALGKLTWDQARRGLARLGNEGRTYPPNLTEVMEACRGKGSPRYLGRPVTPRSMRLGRPTAGETVIAKHLASMRALFGPTREPGEDDGPIEPSERAEGGSAVKGCTCKLVDNKTAGDCPTCVAYRAAIDGEPVTLPRD